MPYREWQQDEIDRLARAVALHTKKGRTSWGDVAQIVKTRTPRQCQDRYLNRTKNADRVVTKSNNIHVSWTQEEETLLKELVSLHGHKWSMFYEYFPGRDANKIKSKYYNFYRLYGEPSYDTTQTSAIEQSISWKCTDYKQPPTDPMQDDVDDVLTGDFYEQFNQENE